MNPASRIWDIPPPPGTEDIDLEPVAELKKEPEAEPEPEPKKEIDTPPKEKSVEKEEDKPPERPIDRFNPYLKNPEYIEYEKRRQERKQRSRSRSHSRDRYHRRRYSRSRSRDRYRRSRSRSRRRRRRYSSSKSRSRSPSHHRRHKYSRRRRSVSKHSRSRSKSKSASRSRHGSRRPKTHKDKKSRSKSPPNKPIEEKIPDVDTHEVDMKIEEEEDDANKDNVFKNDGSFLEMFKKMQEQQKVKEEPPTPLDVIKRAPPVFGKRRGGKVLKTGLVQKVRLPNEEDNSSQDAWSVYMKEVRKYKEACCDDDSKTRPLVK